MVVDRDALGPEPQRLPVDLADDDEATHSIWNLALLGVHANSALNNSAYAIAVSGSHARPGARLFLPVRGVRAGVRDGVDADADPGVRLHHPRQFHRDRKAVPITFVDFRPVIDATVEVASTPPAHGSFFVDTGSESELELADNFLQRHGFEKWAATAFPTESVMLHGRVPSRSAHGLKLQVGAVSTPTPLVEFGGVSGLGYEEKCDGMIGSGFLRKFHVIIDYPRKRLWLEAPVVSTPTAAPSTAP
jgi:hypothetical protein